MDQVIPPQKRALLRAAELLGGQGAVAATLGMKRRQNVWPWFATDRPFPAEHCPAIERATGGAVRCEDLRPDIEWGVLRAAPAPAQKEVRDAA